MTSNESKKTTREKVLAKIDTQHVHMRSRSFFLLKIVGIAALAIAILAISLLIGNLVFFTIRLNGQDALLGFGPHGISLFFQTFPWLLFIIDIVLVVLLERLLRQFRFGYRSPMLYVLLAIIVVVSLGGALIDNATPLNDTFLHAADEGHLPPPLGSLYQQSRRQPPPGSGLYRGTIIDITATTTTITDPDENFTPLLVLLPTMGPAAHEPFSKGEAVIVVGNKIDGVVHAVDIHSIDQNGIPPRPQH